MQAQSIKRAEASTLDRGSSPSLFLANELSVGIYGFTISNNGESGIGGSSGNLGRSGFI